MDKYYLRGWRWVVEKSQFAFDWDEFFVNFLISCLMLPFKTSFEFHASREIIFRLKLTFKSLESSPRREKEEKKSRTENNPSEIWLFAWINNNGLSYAHTHSHAWLMNVKFFLLFHATSKCFCLNYLSDADPHVENENRKKKSNFRAFNALVHWTFHMQHNILQFHHVKPTLDFNLASPYKEPSRAPLWS